MTNLPKIEIKSHEGPISVHLADGSVLFTRQRVTYIQDIRQTPFGPFDFGESIFWPAVEWVRYPDGTEAPCSHLAAMLAQTTPKPTIPKRKRFWYWLWGKES